MADNFNAGAFADHLRTEASVEIHNNALSGPLLDTYATLNSGQLKSVAHELEAKNAGFSAAPVAEIKREDGEVKSLVFTPGKMDIYGDAHRLTLTNHGDFVDFAKEGEHSITMTGKEVHDHSGFQAKLISMQLEHEHAAKDDTIGDALGRYGISGIGAAIGRHISQDAPATNINSGIELSGRRLASEGSFIRGLTLGGGLEVAELGIANSLKVSHPDVAAFLRPTLAEAAMVGAAAAVGTASLKLRAGFVAGAWLVAKAENLGELVYSKSHEK